MLSTTKWWLVYYKSQQSIKFCKKKGKKKPFFHVGIIWNVQASRAEGVGRGGIKVSGASGASKRGRAGRRGGRRGK
jgi:hypothetical protein